MTLNLQIIQKKIIYLTRIYILLADIVAKLNNSLLLKRNNPVNLIANNDHLFAYSLRNTLH